MSEPTNSYFMTRPQLVNYTKRLETEVQKWTQEANYWRIEATTDHDRWLRVLEDNERLRKAGDAMAEEIIGCYRAEGFDPADSETLPKWNLAKEGKNS